MKDILLKRFKAFDNTGIELSAEGDNLLVCGENGSGKSSIFEALKLAFFRKRVIDDTIPATAREEDRPGLINDRIESYRNRRFSDSFQFFINGADYSSAPRGDLQVSMIDSKPFSDCESLSLKDLLKKMWLDMPPARLAELIDDDTQFELIQDYLNRVVNEDFRENIKLIISRDAPYQITLIDSERNLTVDDNLTSFFNESKLHIVVMAVFSLLVDFNVEKASDGNNKKQLIVIDDVISSLDTANRMLYVQFLIKAFVNTGYQLVVLTHNVGFRNIFSYVKNNFPRFEKARPWHQYNLYDINGCSRCYPVSPDLNLKELTEKVRNLADTDTIPDSLGNDIRRQTESLIHQYAEVIALGVKEEVKDIIAALSNREIYFNPAKTGKDKFAGGLIKEISGLLDNVPDNLIKNKIREKIDAYRYDDKEITGIIHNLQLCRKVVLHPMSHIAYETVNYTVKELKYSCELLNLLKARIDKLRDAVDLSRG